MRSAYARSVGYKRLIGGGGADPLPVEDTINIADFVGQTAIDITQVQGVNVADFYMIDVVFDAAATTGSGAGVLKGVRVSTDGGSSFLATGYINSVPGATTNVSMVHLADTASPFTSWCRLANTNVAAIPCHFKNTWGTQPPNMGRINSTMAVIDALSFVVAGGPVWASGTIRIVGYRKPASKISTQVVTFDGIVTERIINIPAKATFATMEVEDVSAGVSFGLVARFGNGGVFRADADQQRQRITALTTGVQGNAESVFWITDSGVTQDAHAEFWNLNTAAPVIMVAMQGDTGSSIRSLMMSPVATAFSQMRLFGFSASEVLLTGGTIRITFYEIKNTVFSWAPDGSASHDFTGLNFPGVVLTIPTLVPFSATDSMRATVNSNVGATDYRPHVSATQTQEAAFRLAEDVQSNARLSAVFTSFNRSLAHTQMSWGSNHHSSLIRQVAGLRNAAEKDTSLQVKTTSGALMNAAPLPIYAVGYKL